MTDSHKIITTYYNDRIILDETIFTHIDFISNDEAKLAVKESPDLILGIRFFNIDRVIELYYISPDSNGRNSFYIYDISEDALESWCDRPELRPALKQYYLKTRTAPPQIEHKKLRATILGNNNEAA